MSVHLAIGAAGRPPRDRLVAFPHRRHTALGCTACHGTEVSLAPVDSAATCRGCHDKHHQAGRSCATCHRSEVITQVHAPPTRVHVECDRCHPTAVVAALTPTRSFCLICHGTLADHNRGRECSTCHLQATPENDRARLMKSRDST